MNVKLFAVALLLLTCGITSVGCGGTPVQPKNSSATTGDFREGRLHFPEVEFDFGFVPQETFVSHSYWLLNRGADTLEVIQIKPG